MSDLLDKHSPDYDPDRFVGLVDDDRKRRKENPAAFAIKNVYTGELLDPDDLPALKIALQEIEDYLAEKRRPLRPIYQARDQIQARVAELDPIGLPRPRNQTAKQQRVALCPRCRTAIETDSDPQAAASSLGVDGSSGEGSSTGAASTATLAEAQSSESGKSAAAGPAADMAPPEELSPPAGDVPDGASPAPSLKEET